MFAVIKTGGKQYRVAQDDVIVVEKLAGDAGDTLVFGEVLMIGDGDKVEMGAPVIGGAQVVGNDAHALGVAFVFFAAESLQFFNDGPHQADLEHVRAVNSCRGNALQAAAKVDILFLEWLKTTILKPAVLHEHLVADFHELAAVAGRVCQTEAFGVVLRTEIVKHLTIRAARVADRRFV